MDVKKAKKRISDIFHKLGNARRKDATRLLSGNIQSGKLYEAWVLAEVIKNLVNKEGFTVRYVNSVKLKLKSSPGPINHSYPHFLLEKNSQTLARLWTDVEFRTLSSHNNSSSVSSPGEYHELDIMICDHDAIDRPSPDQIWLGVECKNREKSTKGMLREMLGLRRELSLLQGMNTTKFKKWPLTHVPAQPASCLMFYSVDNKPSLDWVVPGAQFGINFEYLSI